MGQFDLRSFISFFQRFALCPLRYAENRVPCALSRVTVWILYPIVLME